MGTIENQWRFSVGRRRALASLATMLAGSPLLRLGAFGAAGTERLLQIVQEELVQAAALAGRRTLKDIDKTAVKANFV